MQPVASHATRSFKGLDGEVQYPLLVGDVSRCRGLFSRFRRSHHLGYGWYGTGDTGGPPCGATSKLGFLERRGNAFPVVGSNRTGRSPGDAEPYRFTDNPASGFRRHGHLTRHDLGDD